MKLSKIIVKQWHSFSSQIFPSSSQESRGHLYLFQHIAMIFQKDFSFPNRPRWRRKGLPVISCPHCGQRVQVLETLSLKRLRQSLARSDWEILGLPGDGVTGECRARSYGYLNSRWKIWKERKHDFFRVWKLHSREQIWNLETINWGYKLNYRRCDFKLMSTSSNMYIYIESYRAI